ncbi:MAG: hypothetical protein LBD80_02650 [Tannerella sp.]|nr:hypothetical protein [Tannerella sp.]
MKSVAETYIASIHAIRGDCDENGWQKVEALISIAKKAPQLLKENGQQISRNINKFHEDTIHSDRGSRSSDCHFDTSAANATAASKGLVFPPYPFDD